VKGPAAATALAETAAPAARGADKRRESRTRPVRGKRDDGYTTGLGEVRFTFISFDRSIVRGSV
jgi:hypothetical protein